MATITVRPDGEDSKDGITSGTYQDIDEEILDVGDYIVVQAGGYGYYTATMSNSGLTSQTINSIKIYMNCDAPAEGAYCYVLPNITSAITMSSEGGGYYTVTLATNQTNGGGAWTISNIESLIIRFLPSDVKNSRKIYQAYVVVNYTEGGTTVISNYYYAQQ